MALTDLGFERPSYAEILEAQTDRAKTLFGETIDTSELTALGKYIRINAADIDTLYQSLEGVYYARFPNTASGTSLDRLCPFAGITRNAATFARHSITITGTPFAVVEAGFEVSSENQSVVFHTIEDYTIGSSGTVTAYVDCNNEGTIGNLTVGTINTIVNPLADVDSITHTAITEYGEERESDVDLRKRFKSSVSGAGSGTAKSIKGAVMRVADVEDCYIIENTTGSTVGNCAPYSFECIVLYDGETSTKQLIAEAIFSKKPIGIATSGLNTISVTDDAGEAHSVKFTDTTKVNINVSCTVHKNSLFESDGVNQIKERLMNYINSLGNGETVYVSQLYSCIHITGVDYVSSLGIKKTTDAAMELTNITFANNEVARTASDLIAVYVLS
jgi:uncharacterized phage protein gp47/JayE